MNKISANRLIMLASILSITISENLSSDESDLLGNLLTQIGASLLTISSATANNEALNNDNNTSVTPKNTNNNQYDVEL